jgi:tetratricopeptide (TPR) repeat protein
VTPDACDRHATREVARRFLRGEASHEEARAVVRHLVAGCPECRRTVGAGWARETAGPPPTSGPDEPTQRVHSRRLAANVLAFSERPSGPDDYQPVFERVAVTLAAREREFAAERREVPALKSRLADMSPPARRRAMRNDPDFQRWALVEALIEEGREASVSDAARALELAEVALEGAAVLDEARYSAAALADLAARAWAQRGNALRILARFTEAQQSLERADELLARGSGDPAERCRVLMMSATLLSAQKRYDEAAGRLDRALRMARRAGERHLEGSALVRKALIAQRREDAEGALELLRRSLSLIDHEEDPRLLLVAQHNLLLLMVDTGRYREALDRMDETRVLHHQLGGRHDFLRFRWAEGRTYAGLGWLRQAAAHYEESRRGFIAEGLAYDVALVSLDLAAVYAQEGRDAEVRGLAEEMLPIFRSAEAHQEALAALLVFHEAARREAATVGLIHHVADYLRRARGNPDLPFRPEHDGG